MEHNMVKRHGGWQEEDQIVYKKRKAIFKEKEWRIFKI